MERRTKVQSPAAVAALTVATIGIYTLFWYYRVNREMRDFGRAGGDEELATSKPVLSVLAWVPGGWIVIPVLVSFARASGRLARCERLAGMEPAGTGALVALIVVAAAAGVAAGFVSGTSAAVLVIVDVVCAIVAMAGFQRRLNAVWRRDPIALPVAGYDASPSAAA